MPVDSQVLWQLVCELSEEEGLKVTVTESLKNGAAVGALVFLGGLLAGPAGLAIGGIVGGGLAAYNAQGKFLPVAEVLRKLPEEKRESLLNKLYTIVDNIDATDVVMFTQLFMCDPIRGQMLGRVRTFLTDELAMKIYE